MMTPTERSERARAAAYAMHAKHPPDVHCDAVVAATWARYERQADPEGALEPEERRRRARHLLKADLARNRLAALRREREAKEAAADAALAVEAAQIGAERVS